MYKGVFWYNPVDKKLIVKKAACDYNGVALEPVEYSSKSGANFNHKAEWAKLPREMTNGQPYNYYPRGRVEIKKSKATIYLSPVLMEHDTHAKEPWCPLMLVEKEFGLGLETIRMHVVADNSEHYQYLIEYPTKVCNMCGKTFDRWDHQEDFCFDHHIGYGSAHDFEHIQLNLCCQCFDKAIDWILPQCKYNPISESREGNV